MKYTRTLLSIALAALIVLAGNLFQGLSQRLIPPLGVWSSTAFAQDDQSQYDSALLLEQQEQANNDNKDEDAPGVKGSNSRSGNMGQSGEYNKRSKNFIRVYNNE